MMLFCGFVVGCLVGVFVGVGFWFCWRFMVVEWGGCFGLGGVAIG